MQLFLFSLSCIFPFFVYLLVGYFSKYAFEIGETTYFNMNSLALNVMMPINCFLSTYQINLTDFRYSLSIFFPSIGLIIIFAISTLFYSKRKISNKTKPVMIQTTFNTNYLLLGIPLVQSILEEPMTEISSLGLAFSLPIVNFLTVFTFVFYSEKKLSIIKLIKNVIRNPLIIASVVGLFFNMLSIELPNILMVPLYGLGSVTTPLALISLGGIFTLEWDKSLKKVLLEIVILRLFVVPFIVLSIAIFMGFKGEDLALQLIVFSTPISVTSFSLSLEFNANSKLAEQSLVFTTIISIFTMLFLIMLLKNLSLI